MPENRDILQQISGDFNASLNFATTRWNLQLYDKVSNTVYFIFYNKKKGRILANQKQTFLYLDDSKIKERGVARAHFLLLLTWAEFLMGPSNPSLTLQKTAASFRSGLEKIF